MKASLRDFKPGRILYYVSCVDRFRARNAKLASKIIVLGEPNCNNNVGSLCFDCVDDYTPYGFDWVNVKAHHFLGDCGADPTREPYNLHRIFTSEDAALRYVNECHLGRFSDPVDQRVYDDCTERDDDITYWLDTYQ